jgi:hypothetical protein
MNPIELPPAPGVEVAADGGRRRRNVVAGEGLVTPRKPLELREDGRDELLQPGRSRLSPDHWAVKERPELFQIAMSGDRGAASQLRALLVRARQEVRLQMRGGRPSSRGRLNSTRRLPARRAGCRLP